MFEQLYNALLNAINNQQNEFLSAGLILGTLTAIAAYARRLPARAYYWTLSRFIITLEITNEDPSFFWVAGWLSQLPYSQRSRNITVTTYRDAYGNLRRTIAGRGVTEQNCVPSSSKQPEQQLPEIIFTPAPGNHLFFYKRRPVWLVRSRENQKPDQGGYSFFTKESFQIKMIARNQATAKALIEEARQLSYIEREVRTDIFVYSGYDGFRRVDSCDPRPLSSVFLPEGLSDEIVSKIRKFLDSQHWYQQRGIPWRMGFLFHGIPGTGKSSLIRAVTGEFKMDLYLINLADRMDDSRFAYALASVPPRSAILLEDVDAIFNKREKNDDVKNELSFAGVLNALDGVASREGWIVFMTTNRKEVLDPALIRKGRADHHIEFTYANAYQGKSIFRAFFPDAEGAETFGRVVEQRTVPMCDVQAHLVDYQHSAVEALASLELPEAIEEVA